MRRGWGWGAVVAALLVVAPAAAQEAPEDPRADATLVEAQERLERGQALFDEENYDAALAEFQAAEVLLAEHPALYLVLYNIGKTYEVLFRYDQAMTYYRRYLAEGGAEQEDAPEVRAKIQLLEGLLGTIRIAVNLSAYEVWIDDQLVGENKTEVLVPGGNHLVEIRAEGHNPEQQEVQVPARATRELSFELEEQFEGLPPGYFWASAGLAVAAVAVGGVFGVRALTERNDYDDCVSQSASDLACNGAEVQESIGDNARNADIMFGVGGLFAVGAVVFAVFTEWGGDGDGDAEPDATEVRLVPAGSPSSAGLVLEGRF
ncbi:MAG: tetratricopeptide repeat protein [Myxococcota bacterium]